MGIGRGVKSFVKFICRAMKFYGKYKGAIDTVLNNNGLGALISPLTAILESCERLDALNPEGAA